MILFTSCQKGAGAKTVVPNYAIAETKLNVSYGEDSLQRMDIYLPANRSAGKTKSIVLIHGGGLPDYAIFNIDYRLATSQTIFPTQENDVKSAIDFIVNHSGEFGIDKSNMALLGASAGAHLALLQAYKYSDVPVKAVIDFFGPTDLTVMYRKPWHSLLPYLLEMLTGTSPDKNAKAYEQSSPAHFVTAQSAPTLIFHGGSDNIVVPSQSQLLAAKLEKAGVEHELVIYPKERHGWQGANLTDSFDRMVKFLESNM
jgi:acetyl esterase/lipase